MRLKMNLGSILILLATKAAFSADLSPNDIIKRVDDIRNPGESYRMKVLITSEDSTDHSRFEVAISGNNKTLVKTIEPPRDKGRNLLMLEDEMWAFIPNLKRAVRISLSQKLTGQAANGDISRMRWSGDYEPIIESETDKEWVVFLTAKRKGLTYDRIRAWIEKRTFYPKKAEFLTLASKALKTAKYSDFKELAGRVRPSTIEIQDVVKTGDKSIIKIENMDVRSFPESLFNQNSLR